MTFLCQIQTPTDVRHKQDKTIAYVNDESLETGSLFIAESCLVWMRESGLGFYVEYPDITMHSISRDLSAFPQQCLYVVLDVGINAKVGDNSSSSSSSDCRAELRFIPDDSSALTLMFSEMSLCQRLHPDKELAEEDDIENDDDDNDSDLDLMPEVDQVIFQRTQQHPNIVMMNSTTHHQQQQLECAIEHLMSNGGDGCTYAGAGDGDTEADKDQFEDAEADHQ